MRRGKTIGIVGGMSPESTAIYYQHVVRHHMARRGDHAYPRVVIASVSFADYVRWQHDGQWSLIAAGLGREIESLAAAGADFALLATNTMHKVLPHMSPSIPILHVLDAVCAYARRRGLSRLGLTGTKFTMEDGFYASGLKSRGMAVVLPDKDDRAEIHRIIYEELIAGRVERGSCERMSLICGDLARRGAEAVLLGCTELGMLVQGHAPPVATIDTAIVHAEAAWELAMGWPESVDAIT